VSARTAARAELGETSRRIPVLAQDPTITDGMAAILTEVELPAEPLAPGPRGSRVHVIDYDASRDTLYKPAILPVEATSAKALLQDPAFHAQQVYAVVMQTLAHFEKALGRRVAWGFDGHQIHVAPHAFEEPNAYYSRRDRALYFGYFTDPEAGRVHTCLSYDVVAHETAHALLDGLRERYLFPSSPDQAGFHEGFADVVALLSVFALPKVVASLMAPRARSQGIVRKSDVTIDKLKETALFGLGESLDLRRGGLRRSVQLPEDETLIDTPPFQEPHRRGELFVAAALGAFLRIWRRRIEGLAAEPDPRLFAGRVAEEGQAAAQHLLIMVIRALDYAPATDLLFGDFLSALLTSDLELQPDDSRYGYREALREGFAAFGILPSSDHRVGSEGGLWQPPPQGLDRTGLHFEAMRQDRDEVFRFLWQNRKALELSDAAYTRVHSLRPCLRISSDGAYLRETVAEYHQILDLRAFELPGFGLEIPPGMPSGTSVTLYGGGALIFDEFGALKYHIRNRVLDPARQNRRLRYLWSSGFFQQTESPNPFADMHRVRNQDGGREMLVRDVSHARTY